jgi:Uma2 family endonuclease
MEVMVSPYPVRSPSTTDDHRLVIENVSWDDYVAVRDAITSPAVQMIYLEGRLEIVVKGMKHEVSKKQIARLFELFCLERDIPLFGYGEMTKQRKAKSRALEPDEWYNRGAAGLVPALALEVIVSRGAIDKLRVYAGLGVREVWLHENGRITVVALRGRRYDVIPESELFPEAPLDRIAHHAQNPDQHAALTAFRDELRAKR